jgi:hypothetical protein
MPGWHIDTITVKLFLIIVSEPKRGSLNTPIKLPMHLKMVSASVLFVSAIVFNCFILCLKSISATNSNSAMNIYCRPAAKQEKLLLIRTAFTPVWQFGAAIDSL